MKFNKLVSVLCSATCGIAGVGAKPSGGMKEKIAQMKEESEEKGSKSLVTFRNFVRHYFWPGRFSKKDKEVIEARGALELLSGELFGKEKTADIMVLLEKLDKDSEAQEEIIELVESRKFWISVIEPVRKALTFWACVFNVFSPLLLFTLPAAIIGIKQVISEGFEGRFRIPYFGDKLGLSELLQTQAITLSMVHCVLLVLGTLFAAISVSLEYKSLKLKGNKKVLKKLIGDKGEYGKMQG